MDILSSFGETLAVLIFDQKILPEQLAEAVKIDKSVIYRYLRKESIPALPNAILIADYFHCSLDFLFGRATETSGTHYKAPPPFSIRFQEILKNKGYSRYKLCKEAQLADQRVDDWFHGKRIPTIDSLLNLANFFDCSLDYLVGRE